jgi:FKBP-type peptidyl-prolyl cis-trans isomerase FkpA
MGLTSGQGTETRRHRDRWFASCFGVFVALGLLTTGCAGSATSPSQSAPFSQTDLKIGTGDPVTTGTVTVNYTGWLYDPTKTDKKGLQFDTSTGRGPFQFILNNGDVIKGWDQGVPGMMIGGVRRLVIPPSLAYGATRNGLIPPNATLVFDIELVSAP